VRLLPDCGTVIDVDNKGRAPLRVASSRRNIQVVRLLLDRGANANAVDNGKTPLHVASFLGQTEVVYLLLKMRMGRE